MLDVLFLLAGFYLLAKGADALVEGAATLATRWGMDRWVVGLTVVAWGTSLPEVVVSGLAAAASDDDGEANLRVPRCRRCPALRADTAYVAYVGAEDEAGAGAYHRANNLIVAVETLRLKTAKTRGRNWPTCVNRGPSSRMRTWCCSCIATNIMPSV